LSMQSTTRCAVIIAARRWRVEKTPACSRGMRRVPSLPWQDEGR
jgi:hypothetical protein